MRGWLVNDRLTAIPGTRTLWHHLLDAIPGLVDKTQGTYSGLVEAIEEEAQSEAPDYIIRNAAYFGSLNVDCPQISFVQDILHGWIRDLLIEVCEGSRLVVFNSEYTRAAYPELHAADYRIVPVGTDEAIFAPSPGHPDVPTGAILWVGSGDPVKGFEIAKKQARASTRPWVFVMKDQAHVQEASVVFRNIPQELLAQIASSCAVGVCTSLEETQHLAGIEMGMCGLPLVTTPVGVYSGRAPGPWGLVTRGKWRDDIEAAALLDRDKVAAYWRSEGFGLPNCMAMWGSIVESLEAAHVHG